MYRDYKETEKLRAFNFFVRNGFTATEVVNNEEVLIIDWRGEESFNLSARFLVDKKKGNFVITGDSGDCIASWHGQISPKNLEAYVNSIGYFEEKIQTSSELREFDDELAEKDFRKEIESFVFVDHETLLEFIADVTGDNLDELIESEKEDLKEDFVDDMNRSLEIIQVMNGYTKYIPDELDDILSKWFGGDWYLSGFLDCGNRRSNRIYLWSVGYQMAHEQLYGGKKEESIPVEDASTTPAEEKTSLEAFFEEETPFRLRDIFELPEAVVEKTAGKFAKELYNKADWILNYDAIDGTIQKHLEPILKEGHFPLKTKEDVEQFCNSPYFSVFMNSQDDSECFKVVHEHVKEEVWAMNLDMYVTKVVARGNTAEEIWQQISQSGCEAFAKAFSNSDFTVKI